MWVDKLDHMNWHPAFARMSPAVLCKKQMVLVSFFRLATKALIWCLRRGIGREVTFECLFVFVWSSLSINNGALTFAHMVSFIRLATNALIWCLRHSIGREVTFECPFGICLALSIT